MLCSQENTLYGNHYDVRTNFKYPFQVKYNANTTVNTAVVNVSLNPNHYVVND